MKQPLARGLALLGAGALVLAVSGCASPSAPDSSSVGAQNDPCHVKQWKAPDLYGTWRIELPERHLDGTMLLRQHPEYKASLRGELHYDGHDSIASGDVEQGDVNLDESRDGKSLYAFWTGKLVAQSCGNEIRGTWQKVVPQGEAAVETPFVLRRAGPAPQDE